MYLCIIQPQGCHCSPCITITCSGSMIKLEYKRPVFVKNPGEKKNINNGHPSFLYFSSIFTFRGQDNIYIFLKSYKSFARIFYRICVCLTDPLCFAGYLVHAIFEEALAGGHPICSVEDAVVHREPSHQQHRHNLNRRDSIGVVRGQPE